MNSERVKKALREAFVELQRLGSSLLRQEILEHVGGPIAELLVGSGMFEGRVEAAQALDPYADQVPTATYWTASPISSTIAALDWEGHSDLDSHCLAPLSSGCNLMFGASEVRVASFAASLWDSYWKTETWYEGSAGLQILDWQSVLLVNDNSLVNSLDWRIPETCDEAAEDELMEWAA